MGEQDPEAYDRLVWRGVGYRGLDLGHASRMTPLLSQFLDLTTSGDYVIEAGPGAFGGHTIRLVAAGLRVEAVEASPTAAKALRQRVNGNRLVTIVEGDVVEYVSTPPSSSALLEGSSPHFYAQGMMQFLTNDQRQMLLDKLSKRQHSGSLVGFSIKTIYDELFPATGIITEGPFGTFARCSDNLVRLFADVREVSPYVAELEGHGFDVIAIPRWYEIDRATDKEVVVLNDVDAVPPTTIPAEKNVADWVSFLARKN